MFDGHMVLNGRFGEHLWVKWRCDRIWRWCAQHWQHFVLALHCSLNIKFTTKLSFFPLHIEESSLVRHTIATTSDRILGFLVRLIRRSTDINLGPPRYGPRSPGRGYMTSFGRISSG